MCNYFNEYDNVPDCKIILIKCCYFWRDEKKMEGKRKENVYMRCPVPSKFY